MWSVNVAVLPAKNSKVKTGHILPDVIALFNLSRPMTFGDVAEPA